MNLCKFGGLEAAYPRCVDKSLWDGKPLAVAATQELVLRRGKASIPSPKAGKALILVAYLFSGSSGLSRIQRRSVQGN